MMWKIYKHTFPSGKSYIGQTMQDNPQVRWQYGNGYREHNTYFFKAIKKYGWKNFTHEIIEDNIPTQELANEREIYWIAFYNTFKNGYNSTPGGFCAGEGVANKSPVCQIDKKMLKVLQEFVSESEVERKTGVLGRNIGAVCNHEGQISAGGYYWCFSDELDGFVKPVSKLNKSRKKEVHCYELDRVFGSIEEASNETGGKT